MKKRQRRRRSGGRFLGINISCRFVSLILSLILILLIAVNEWIEYDKVFGMPGPIVSTPDWEQQQAPPVPLHAYSHHDHTNQGAVLQQQEHLLDGDAILLHNQVRLQKQFQRILYKNQHPTVDCTQRRILLIPVGGEPLDGFTLELQFMGWHLKSALSQDRTLIVPRTYQTSYAPESCVPHKDLHNQFECLFQPLSNCSHDMAVHPAAGTHQHPYVNATVAAAVGVNQSSGGSRYQDARQYGHIRVLDHVFAPKAITYADHIAHWDRTMGRFWVRAQTVHYIWKKPSQWLQGEIQKRLPAEIILRNSLPFIGMHVRYSDNVRSLMKDFGRDARMTRSVEYFMSIAQDIRNETGISTIYLATDSTRFLDALLGGKNNSSYNKKNNDKWHFILQPNVTRTNTMEWMWFQESRHLSVAGIATDVEVLRRADYLIGSFQSNVYRLATTLNTAYHVSKYPLHMNRHRSVDVEWFEDP